MSIHFQVYGSTDPFYFKLTKNGLGVNGLTISTEDIMLSIDGGAWQDISGEVTEVDPTVGPAAGGVPYGIYKWQPTLASQTQGKVLILNVAEIAGTNFDENCLIIATGGNASARHSG
jgi:hypothetical protein